MNMTGITSTYLRFCILFSLILGVSSTLAQGKPDINKIIGKYEDVKKICKTSDQQQVRNDMIYVISQTFDKYQKLRTAEKALKQQAANEKKRNSNVNLVTGIGGVGGAAITAITLLANLTEISEAEIAKLVIEKIKELAVRQPVQGKLGKSYSVLGNNVSLTLDVFFNRALAETDATKFNFERSVTVNTPGGRRWHLKVPIFVEKGTPHKIRLRDSFKMWTIDLGRLPVRDITRSGILAEPNYPFYKESLELSKVDNQLWKIFTQDFKPSDIKHAGLYKEMYKIKYKVSNTGMKVYLAEVKASQNPGNLLYNSRTQRFVAAVSRYIPKVKWNKNTQIKLATGAIVGISAVAVLSNYFLKKKTSRQAHDLLTQLINKCSAVDSGGCVGEYLRTLGDDKLSCSSMDKVYRSAVDVYLDH